MKIENVYVYWGKAEENEISFAVDDIPLPPQFRYTGSGGACYSKWAYLTTEQQIMEVLRYAYTAIWLYHVSIEKIHLELCKIEEMKNYLNLGVIKND